VANSSHDLDCLVKENSRYFASARSAKGRRPASAILLTSAIGCETMTDENIRHLPRLGIAGAMRLYGMTARALRFYEEKGLVEARRDRLNARYYDPAARRRLEWISRLRKAGVGLGEIEDVLAADENGRGRETALATLTARREALTAELGALDEALTHLQQPETPRRLGVLG
jgi:DNA-binding transcriptional MerR regulator